MPKVGTLDFLLIVVAIVLAIVIMNKHFIFFKVIFYVILKRVLFTFNKYMLLKDWHLGIEHVDEFTIRSS